MKRTLPFYICCLSCLLMMAAFYSPALEPLSAEVKKWFNIIAVFAYFLGGISLIAYNGQKIFKREPGWGYNLVLLAGLFATLIAGIAGGIQPPAGAYSWRETFFFIFTYIFTPLSATMFALVAFFIASAAFRAFRARTWEAGVLLLTAFIVILGRVPAGEQLWSHIPWLGQWPVNDLIENWIMGCFNTAGQRAILMGATLGLISISLKILLGLEKPYMGGD